MKSFTYIALFLALGSLMSCTEVITLELNDSEPTVVIEAVLDGEASTLTVQITASGSFTNPGEYPTVSNAIVSLAEAGRELVEVPETAPGVYFLEGIVTEAGTAYELSVEIGENTFFAIATMPEAIVLDSISFMASASPQFGEGLSPTFYYQTISGESPWLRINVERIDSSSRSSFLPLENVMRPTNSTLFQASFHAGEMLKLEIQAITEDMYRYLEAIAELKGESVGPGAASAAPANPENQWSGDALGYFSAQVPSRIEVVAR